MDSWIEFVGPLGCVEANCTHLRVAGMNDSFAYPDTLQEGHTWQTSWAGEDFTEEATNAQTKLCRVMGSKGIISVPSVGVGGEVVDLQLTYIKVSVCKQRDPAFRYQGQQPRKQSRK